MRLVWNEVAPGERVNTYRNRSMKEQPHILMLENEPVEAERIGQVLRQGDLDFELERVVTQEEFEHALEEHRPDVILSDHGASEFDSLTALSVARRKRPDVPFILVAGSADDPVTIEALLRGADGFIAKDHVPHWLPKLKRSLRQAEREARHLRTEQALRESQERHEQTLAELQRLVARRTRELQVATKELEAFSYSISHDLRAPLRHINAFIYLLEQSLRGKLTDESRLRLKVVASAAEHLGQLVDDLLNLSRVGRQELCKIPVSLTSLAEEARSHLLSEMGERKVEWVIGSLPTVSGDPIALRQVLVNLFSNALKYSSPRPRSRVEINCREEDGETVCYVRDNGVGFDMKNASRLFGVFQRLHSDKEFEGTGIGLAIVRRIIQRHGGRVWAESEVDQGATFYFSLPKLAEAVAQ